MQFRPDLSEQILSIQGIASPTWAYVVNKLRGASPKMQVVVSKSVQSTSRYLICLYQFPVHGD